jgi:GntP family gluconate:H+ symporter
MDVKTGYKLQTVGTLVQGLTAAVAVYLVSMMVL